MTHTLSRSRRHAGPALELGACGFMFAAGVVLACACLLAGCGRGSEATTTRTMGTILDMTFPYDDTTIYWPNAKPFKLAKGAWGVNDKGYWYAANEYGAAEHGGTHADAPIHFGKNGRTIDQVPLEEWIGPAARIDVTAKCEKDRDYLLQVDDIRQWEAAHGRLPARAWVIMYTGIDTKYYPDKKKVLGTDMPGEAALPYLSFPGFSPQVAEFLVKERDITGLALDTPSIDYGKSQDFKVHQILLGANKLALENIAHLDKLPDTGAMLYVMPMMIGQGTGAPARVFAVLPTPSRP
jgi:kynurenine formamidase